MMPRIERPSVGLLVTAFLEDEFVKTGYLRARVQTAVRELEDGLSGFATVVCPGLVETEAQAAATDLTFRTAGVEAIVLAELAYTQSLVPLRALAGAQVPVIVWNTQLLSRWPVDADWDTVMLNSGLAGLPEATHALLRSGRRFHIVTGHIHAARPMARLRDCVTAAALTQRLRRARIGMVGHPYQSMVDLMVDAFSLRDQVGPTLVHIEPEAVAAATDEVTPAEARVLMAAAQREWRTDELASDIFARSARCALGLERVVSAHALDALANFDQALLSDARCGVVPSWANARLMALGVPVTAEADVSTAVAMLILQMLAGDATFVENYGFDFDQDAAYIAHDSIGNPTMAAAEPQPALRPSIYYQGRYGWGAALEFAYRPGEVTFLALVPVAGGRWRLIAGEGEALPTRPRPIVAPQMLFRPAQSSIEEFYDRWCLAGAGHHSALAYGHLGASLAVVAEMSGLDFELVR